jgi:Purple acid Phosphatase, N-terminal domain
LTWGDDPARSVVVSWSSRDQAVRPRARIGQRVIPAQQRVCTGGLTGRTVWTYHARVHGLRPGATYGYAVTADNDRNAAEAFSATFTTAPEGRAAFRFTSFGDLAAPNAKRAPCYGQSAHAVGAVESFQPLFHLLNGGLCDAGVNPGEAAHRPWMPVPQGFTSYLTRYTLPSNGTADLEGRWYCFRIGSVLFVSLSADDVAYQDAFRTRGYSGGAQTRWLEATLAAARRDASIDWIVAQMHQCACSSSRTGNGSDLGIRQEWLPLFDRYEVDLVLSGHDHDYERSFPVRGFDSGAGSDAATGEPVDTRRPRPVTTVDSGVFDTSQGTVHLILGCGGSEENHDAFGAGAGGGSPVAKVFTRPGRPAPDAVEDATWSARRDTATGYGIAVFDVNPGTEAGGQTSITVTHYHAAGADPEFTLFESFTLVRPRSDGRRWHAKQSTAAVTT